MQRRERSQFQNAIFQLHDALDGIQLVWHGLNDPLNLDYFLKSPVPWGEADIREGGNDGIILRHDSFDTHPLRAGERLLRFEDWLLPLQVRGKKVVVDLKEGGETMEKMAQILKDHRVDESNLWISINLKDVPADDVSRLQKTFPGAVLSSAIPLRFMFQEMNKEDRGAWLKLNHGLGVTRLSASWHDRPAQEELSEMRTWGFEINLYHVNELNDLQEAILLAPDSITSDFHFPDWNLFGRGSGENGLYLEPAKAGFS